MPVLRPANPEERKTWVKACLDELDGILATKDASRATAIDKFISSKVSGGDSTAVDMLLKSIGEKAREVGGFDFDWRYLQTQFERQKNEFRAILPDNSNEGTRRRQIRTEISKDEFASILDHHRTWLWSGRRDGTQANLAGCRFSLIKDDVDLARADLRWADLRGSVLDRVSLVGAALSWACFDGVYMPLADLRNATLVGARGRGANLWQAKFAGANMWGADLQGALLDRAIFDAEAAETSEKPSFRLGPDGILGRSPTSDGLTDVTRVDFRDARLRDARLCTAFGATAGSFAGANVANAQLPPSIEKFDALAQASEALKTIHIVLATLLVTCA
jgi:uncharacterized protein YjbI with pentapeptide repeats